MHDHKVYVIDQDQAVRESTRWLLQAAGWACETYDSALSFLRQCSSPRALRGCIIVDAQMPVMDGLELQQLLRDLGANIPVLVTTGYGDIQEAVTALRRGAQDYLEKPFERGRLLEQVRHAMGTHPPATPRVRPLPIEKPGNGSSPALDQVSWALVQPPS